MPLANLDVFEPNEGFYTKHVTFSSVSTVDALTFAIKKLGLSYFTFDRTYKDGSHIRLTNAGQWIETYYRKKLYDVAVFERNPKLFTDGYVFWSELKREPVYAEASQHNIDHGLTITQPHDLYCDFFHFGTTRDYLISSEFLISQIDTLYNFINFFKQQAQQLIQEAENSRFILPIKSLNHFNLQDISQHNLSTTQFNSQEFSRLYLGEEFDNMYLTPREMEILALLKRAHRPIEIAKQLGLSIRTLETHIKNLKIKFKCTTLFELGYVTGKVGMNLILDTLKSK